MAYIYKSETKTAESVNPEESARPDEFILVTDKTSEVVLSSRDFDECRKLASIVRKCGGEVTIFKSMSEA